MSGVPCRAWKSGDRAPRYRARPAAQGLVTWRLTHDLTGRERDHLQRDAMTIR